MAASCPFYSVPNEILVEFTKYLDRRALHNFSLTCQQTRTISREAMLRDINIYTRGNSAVLFLLRTLFEKPALAARIKTLDLGSYEITFYSSLSDRFRGRIEDPSDDEMENLRRLIEYTWVERRSPNATTWGLFLDKNHCMAYAGLLIAMLPNLEGLTLWLNGFGEGPTDPERDWMTELFNNFIPSLDVPSFQQLHYLELPYIHFRDIEGHFPRLEHLDLVYVDSELIIRDMFEARTFQQLRLQRLELQIDIETAPERYELQQAVLWLSNSLSKCPPPHVSINIFDESGRNGTGTDYEHLFGFIRAAWPTIESLEVRLPMECSSAAKTASLDSMTNLATLVAPFYALVSGEYWNKTSETTCWPNDALSSIVWSLPVQLQVLELVNLDENITAWLGAFLHMKQGRTERNHLQIKLSRRSLLKWNINMNTISHLQEEFTKIGIVISIEG